MERKYETFVYRNDSLVYSEYFDTLEEANKEYEYQIAKYGDCYRVSVGVYCGYDCKMWSLFKNFK